MNKKPILCFIFFLLLAFNAVAQEDFAVTAQDKIDLCPCSNQGYPVYVQNKGVSTTTFSVSFSGSAAKWVKAVPGKFSVHPGVTNYFFVYVNSDCNIEGNYDLNVFVQTSSSMIGVEQNLSFTECYKFDVDTGDLIDVKEGQTSASFSKHVGAHKICEKGEKVLPVLITNKESYGNSYVLSLKGPDWTKLNINEVSLDGNKKGLVLIGLNPWEGAKGGYKLKFDAVTKLGKVKKSKEIDINVDKCYGLKIELEKEEDFVCEETSYDVKVENDGSLLEEINLSTNLDWAKIKINETLVLGGNKETISKLILKPKDISGVFDLEVRGSVVGQEVKAGDKIKLSVAPKEECYKVGIDAKKIVNYYTEEYYNINVVNNGLKKAHDNVSLEGPSWADISPNFLELNPGQKGNLNLYVNPTEDVKADTYKLILKLSFEDTDFSQEIDVSLIKESQVIKNIKWFVKYFQYYIYLGLVILILVFIFIKPIKILFQKIRKKYDGYKIKREKKKQLKEEKKKKEEEKRRLKEENKARQEEEKRRKEEEKRKKKLEEEKKIDEEKKAEKLAKKKKGDGFFKKYLIWFIVLFILIIVSVLIFLSIYFGWVDYSLIKNIFPFITAGLKSVWAYSYYIFIALVSLALIILFFHTLEKEEKKETKEKAKEIGEEKKTEKKERKRKIKFSKFFKSAFKVFLVILVLLAIGFLVYYFFNYVREFFVLYFYYIIIGIIILILIILFMKFYKPIVDFLTKEKK